MQSLIHDKMIWALAVHSQIMRCLFIQYGNVMMIWYMVWVNGIGAVTWLCVTVLQDKSDQNAN
jgi:hypothetical protein